MWSLVARRWGTEAKRWSLVSAAMMVALSGCASPAAGPAPVAWTEGSTASYRVRIEERTVVGELMNLGAGLSIPKERVVEFEADLTVQQVKREDVRLAYRVHHFLLRAPEEKRLGDLTITAHIHPQTGAWLGFDGLPEGPGFESERLETWLSRLLLIPPDGAQVEPGIIWSHPERFHLAATPERIAFDLPWRIQHERTDQLDGVPVATLVLARRHYLTSQDWALMSDRTLEAGLVSHGFARVDARTGLVRVMEIYETGQLAYPMVNDEFSFPWILLGLEGRFTAIRTGLTSPSGEKAAAANR